MIMRIPSLLVVAASIAHGWTVPAMAADLLKKYPLVIICGSEQIARLGYLSEVRSDGTATYLSANGRLAAQVTADGVLQPPENSELKGVCVGRTIEQLRGEGRVIDSR